MTTPHDRFEPGPGWRRATAGEAKPNGSLRYSDGDPTHEPEWWVREAPAPPLPTEPYTVIRVEWRDPEYLTGSHIYTLSSDLYWCPQNRHVDFLRAADLETKITGFEVLADPCSQHYGHEDIEEARRETARAVLDRALEEHARDENGWHDRVAREFGVSS